MHRKALALASFFFFWLASILALSLTIIPCLFSSYSNEKSEARISEAPVEVNPSSSNVTPYEVCLATSTPLSESHGYLWVKIYILICCKTFFFPSIRSKTEWKHAGAGKNLIGWVEIKIHFVRNCLEKKHITIRECGRAGWLWYRLHIAGGIRLMNVGRWHRHHLPWHIYVSKSGYIFLYDAVQL